MFNETELNELELAVTGPDGLSDSPYYMDVFETLGGFSPSVELATAITLSESINTVDDLVSVVGVTIREELLIGAVLTDQVTTEATFSELLDLRGQHSLARAISFNVLFSIDETLNLTRQSVMEFLESLIVSEVSDSIQTAMLFLSETLAISAEIKLGGYNMNLAESLDISADAAINYRAIVSALETIIVGDTQEMSARATVFFDEEIEFSQTIDSKARMIFALEEGLNFGAVINTPEGVYEAWVVNAETKAPWQYDNYPFNSFAFTGNKYLALADSGLYELTGSDDDGTNIDTVIRTGLENFNSNQKKSIPWAYFGYTSSGRLLFKTITTATGQKIENWYELEARTADDDTETRVNIGRGLRSVYWQFELTNIDGAEFELDDIQLMPARLKRRL